MSEKKNMFTMPSMQPKSSSGESSDSLSPSFAEGSEVKASGPEVKLETPAHVGKPEIINPALENNSQVAALAPKKRIEVVALGKGFYNQRRLKEGDKFHINSESEFGSWFKCVDKEFEKKRVEFLKNKKAKK